MSPLALPFCYLLLVPMDMEERLYVQQLKQVSGLYFEFHNGPPAPLNYAQALLLHICHMESFFAAISVISISWRAIIRFGLTGFLLPAYIWTFSLYAASYAYHPLFFIWINI